MFDQDECSVFNNIIIISFSLELAYEVVDAVLGDINCPFHTSHISNSLSLPSHPSHLMSRALVSSILSLAGRASVDCVLGKRGNSGPHNNIQAISSTVIRWGHSVRLIALEDLPHGKAYKGDVLNVRAGYARNYLLPKKMALYATPQNFDRLGMIDPDVETAEQRLARLQRESSMSAADDKYLKQADILKKYLKNKTVSYPVDYCFS
jgi:hypothetical protein